MRWRNLIRSNLTRSREKSVILLTVGLLIATANNTHTTHSRAHWFLALCHCASNRILQTISGRGAHNKPVNSYNLHSGLVEISCLTKAFLSFSIRCDKIKGSEIAGQPVAICSCGTCNVDPSPYLVDFGEEENESNSVATHSDRFISTPGEAVTVVQGVMQTMILKGYVLSKDALSKARAFDESHQVSSTAAAKVAELSKKIGLTDKVHSGVEAAKYVDEKYHVSEVTKSVASYTGRTAVAAATAVVNSSYFAKGALWVSGVLDRASKAAADVGNRGVKK
ncbi:Binding partner of ACD11 1 [Sesamum angolense]|uniref:Binding partner of ACD11 1 n=1 Tax=Sesamum angolense TaxID=2727404 RepID=A0AAE1WH82_9LAMI|nr:Binding partner of ACD11 1 [Sesamum angolense]